MKLNKRGYVDTGYVKYLTDQEFLIFREWVDNLENPSTRMCLKLMMYTGIRVGEAVKLKRDNFSPDFSLMTLQLEKSKGKIKDRIIPSFLRPELIMYCRKYRHRMRNNYLFFTTWRNQSTNDHLLVASIEYQFTKFRRQMGYDKPYYVCRNGKNLYRISPHTLRHYALTRYYVVSGNCLKTAQEMIGHADIKTTAQYINALMTISNERMIAEKAFDLPTLNSTTISSPVLSHPNY